MLKDAPVSSLEGRQTGADTKPVQEQPRRCLNCGNPITDDTRQYQLFCSSFCRYEIEEKQ